MSLVIGIAGHHGSVEDHSSRNPNWFTTSQRESNIPSKYAEGETVRFVYMLWASIFLAAVFVLPPEASSGTPGSQMYCSHPTHGKGGYFGPCHPGTNSPLTSKDLNDHVKANPSHSGYLVAQACTT